MNVKATGGLKTRLTDFYRQGSYSSDKIRQEEGSEIAAFAKHKTLNKKRRRKKV